MASAITTRTTRRKRKAPDHVVFDDTILDDILEQEEDDKVLAQVLAVSAAEEQQRQEKKKQREQEEELLLTTKYEGNIFELVPSELLPRIFSFVPSVRQIFNLSLCNRTFRASITIEMIIRAALCGKDRNAKNVLTNILGSIEQKKIRTPSKWRLLRLLNGYFCERMEQCLGFHLVHKVPSRMDSTSVRPFGLCICHQCAKSIGCSTLFNWRTRIQHDRIATYDSSTILMNAQMEFSTNDAIGPIVTGTKIKQVDISYPFRRYSTNERDDVVDKLFLEADETLVSEEEKEHTEYVLDLFHAVSSELEAKERAKDDEAVAKRNALKKRKRELGEPVLQAIEELLEDYPHKDLALRGDFGSWSGARIFECRVSQDILGRLLYAPSSASRKRIRDAVRDVRAAIDTLHQIGIGNGRVNLLSCIENSQQPHLKAIYKIRFLLQDSDALSEPSVLHRYTFDMRFVEDCRNGNQDERIYSLLSMEDKQTAFIQSVVKDEGNEQTKELFRALAKVLWRPRRGYWARIDDLYSLSSFRLKYLRAKAAYKELSSKMRTYLRKKKVKEFNNETGPPDDRPHQVFSRYDALKRLFELKHDSRELLEREQFSELFALQKRIFRNPQQYPDRW